MDSKALMAMHRKVANFYQIPTDCFLEAKKYGTPRACDCRRVYWWVLNNNFALNQSIIGREFGLGRGAIHHGIDLVRTYEGEYKKSIKELLKLLDKYLKAERGLMYE